MRLGGDRVTEHMQYYHKTLSNDYYLTALSLIPDYNDKTHNVVVFSDNITKAKEMLGELSNNFTFINNNNVYDFIFMSLCDVNIVGNSTFSWWSAYMNQNPNKVVIVPEKEWFGPGYKHFNLKETFPKSWIRI